MERFIAWDIETDNSDGNGLDPTKAPIISIAAALYEIEAGQVAELSSFCRTAEALSQRSGSLDLTGEQRLLMSFDDWMFTWALRSATNGPVPLVGWNSTCFDAPFVASRAARNSLVPEAAINGVTYDADWTPIPSASLGLALRDVATYVPKYEPLPDFDGGHDHCWFRFDGIDLAYGPYDADRCAGLGVKHSLKPVAEHHGIEMFVIDRTRLHEATPEALLAYNMSDVRGTAALYAMAGGLVVPPTVRT